MAAMFHQPSQINSRSYFTFFFCNSFAALEKSLTWPGMEAVKSPYPKPRLDIILSAHNLIFLVKCNKKPWHDLVALTRFFSFIYDPNLFYETL